MRAFNVIISDHLCIDNFFVVLVGICGSHVDDDINREEQKGDDLEKQKTPWPVFSKDESTGDWVPENLNANYAHHKEIPSFSKF